MELQYLATVSAIAAFALAPAAWGQTPSAMSSMNNPSSAVSAGDRKFVQTAGEAGLAEMEMAKTAQQRGSSADVKRFADRMIADHGKANDELKSIATKKSIVVPDKLSAKDARELSKLQKIDATKFDKEYVTAQLAAHKDAVNLFKKESTVAKDADLKAFSTLTLPTLQDHLSMVTSMSKNTR